jgi:hypothetical protein
MKKLPLAFLVATIGLAATCRADSQDISGVVSDPNTGKTLFRINLSIPIKGCSDEGEIKALREENEVLRAQLDLYQKPRKADK